MRNVTKRFLGDSPRLLVSLLVAGLTFYCTTGLRAQDVPKEEITRPITKAGSAAFIFTLGGLGQFNIGAPVINGIVAGIGAKWYLADDVALRVLLGLSSNQSPSLLADTTKALSTSAFGIGVGGEYHFRPLYSTSPYVGLQVGYTTMSLDSERAIPGPPPVQYEIESEKTTSFGVTALAGFDWFFSRGMAVGAEMGLGFISNGGTKSNGAPKITTSSIAVATNGSVHFIVYF